MGEGVGEEGVEAFFFDVESVEGEVLDEELWGDGIESPEDLG